MRDPDEERSQTCHVGGVKVSCLVIDGQTVEGRRIEVLHRQEKIHRHPHFLPFFFFLLAPGAANAEASADAEAPGAGDALAAWELLTK